MAAFYAAWMGLDAILPDAVMRFVHPFLILGAIAGVVLMVARIARQPKVTLDVWPESINVDDGRGGIFGYAGAKLGILRTAGLGTTAGTALHLVGAERRFLIGGQDHRPSLSLWLEAVPVDEVDVTLPARDFDALLAALPDAVFRSRWDAPTTPAPLRVALLPNPSAGTFRVMLPWLGTIAACVMLTVVFEATGLEATRWGRTLEGPLIYGIVIVGIVLTIVRSLRRKPGREIEVDDGEVRLRDPSGRVIAATPRPFLGVTRGIYSYRGKTSFDQMVLTLRLSPKHEVAMGLYDARFRWREAVPVKRAPRWIVGVPDWDALVERLGLSSTWPAREGGRSAQPGR